ncbi:ABC transporter ATP-binding protein [Falsiroseomonas stagni]|uniref:Branched-chain amino acid transport system ATP-binding protein n=1 Tax=Falsiroseomonas stagni DSM 19981 TaxID=1123062 RepID=A0A1I4E9F5_9PROT|nr:branched-chain amino acid transport system ATP-binding protein [Falsiroseomonas stagni DSM 19981]
MLDVADLHAAYGRILALKGITLRVETGEITALVGGNGAGKTTLLRCLSGVHPVKSGRVTFHGDEITAFPAHARVAAGIAQSPEGRQVFGPLSVEDNLRLGAFRRGRADTEAGLDRVYGMFDILKTKRHLQAAGLSGGQQQMLAIGRALMSGPRLLLLDEPSMGLAPLLVDQILAAVVALKAQGVTVLLVEQNASAALSIADRGYVIETGRIAHSGTGLALLHDPAVREAYLGV